VSKLVAKLAYSALVKPPTGLSVSATMIARALTATTRPPRKPERTVSHGASV
jgi:hypothetical protein